MQASEGVQLRVVHCGSLLKWPVCRWADSFLSIPKRWCEEEAPFWNRIGRAWRKLLISLGFMCPLAVPAAKLYSRTTFILPFLCSQENFVLGIQVLFYFKVSQQLSHQMLVVSLHYFSLVCWTSLRVSGKLQILSSRWAVVWLNWRGTNECAVSLLFSHTRWLWRCQGP